MPNFAVTLVHASNWDTNRPIRGQARWIEHAAFMDGLVDDRFIVVGGPRRAAATWADDRIAYTEAKSDIILSILQAAEQWTSEPRR